MIQSTKHSSTKKQRLNLNLKGNLATNFDRLFEKSGFSTRTKFLEFLIFDYENRELNKQRINKMLDHIKDR